MSSDNAARETGLRLRATLRTILSPGIWLVLSVQMALAFAMHGQLPADDASLASTLTILLIATGLMLFYYLQAGAFHGLTLSRETLAVTDMMRAGKTVFAAFVWLTLKAGLLLALVMNVLIFLAMLLTGQEIKAITGALAPRFSIALGVLSFVFVYWLPFVFARREFRLFPSLKAALRIAWHRLSRSPFLALLILGPVLVSYFLPGDVPLWIDLAISLAGGAMGWIAYIYCIEVLPEDGKPVDGAQPV